MKTIFFKPFFAVAVSLLLFTSCSNDDDNSSVNNNNNNNKNVSSIVNTASSGTWRITTFVDSGNDETNHFTNYDFTFGANGVLTATNGTTQSGTWSVTDSDNSNDDSPDDDVDFNIMFNASAPADFIDLNDDWDVVQVTSNTISLIDVSGGNGGTDTLIFTKNN